MLQAKTAPPATGMHKGFAHKPLLDCATQSVIIKLGNALYLMMERPDTGEAIEVVGRWIRGSNRADTLRPDKNKGEFVHKHGSGYYYLLAKVEAADAEGILSERNASR